jgi:aminoglycoside 3-N-acetyltransferase
MAGVPPCPVEQLVRQLHDLGVQPGAVLVVHAAFSKVGPVEGGPSGLVAALRAAIGPNGTLVMPSMSYDDDHPFDPGTTPCPHMGVVADTFWRTQGVLRSDNPSSFAAVGPRAEQITAAHPVDPPHGPDSPVGRACELDAQVLLLGAGHDANTTIHLAENLAGVRYRRKTHVTVVRNGAPTRFEYREIDHCCKNFSFLDHWLDADHLQRRGTVGHAEARLARSRDIVAVATEQLRADETVFLHSRGVCEECDDAWQSLAGSADVSPG